jgi:hypothetical protein
LKSTIATRPPGRSDDFRLLEVAAAPRNVVIRIDDEREVDRRRQVRALVAGGVRG